MFSTVQCTPQGTQRQNGPSVVTQEPESDVRYPCKRRERAMADMDRCRSKVRRRLFASSSATKERKMPDTLVTQQDQDFDPLQNDLLVPNGTFEISREHDIPEELTDSKIDWTDELCTKIEHLKRDLGVSSLSSECWKIFIQAIKEPNVDLLVHGPLDFPKSLCYIVPALHQAKTGQTIVIVANRKALRNHINQFEDMGLKQDCVCVLSDDEESERFLGSEKRGPWDQKYWFQSPAAKKARILVTTSSIVKNMKSDFCHAFETGRAVNRIVVDEFNW